MLREWDGQLKVFKYWCNMFKYWQLLQYYSFILVSWLVKYVNGIKKTETKIRLITVC